MGVRNVLDYCNPFSKNFDSLGEFRGMTPYGKAATTLLKVAIVFLSIIVGISTLGLGGVATFRALTNRFSAEPPSEDPVSALGKPPPNNGNTSQKGQPIEKDLPKQSSDSSSSSSSSDEDSSVDGESPQAEQEMQATETDPPKNQSSSSKEGSLVQNHPQGRGRQITIEWGSDASDFIGDDSPEFSVMVYLNGRDVEFEKQIAAHKAKRVTSFFLSEHFTIEDTAAWKTKNPMAELEKEDKITRRRKFLSDEMTKCIFAAIKGVGKGNKVFFHCKNAEGKTRGDRLIEHFSCA